MKDQILCYNPVNTGIQRNNDYEYKTLEEPQEDFGEENVLQLAIGIVLCREDERGDLEDSLIVVDTAKVPVPSTKVQDVVAWVYRSYLATKS